MADDDNDRVTLLVAGQRFEAWTDVTVSTGIETGADYFSVEFAERISDAAEPVLIRRGDACVVQIGGETVITGFVDASAPAFDADTRSLRVDGRSRAADLVDCSALNTPGVWKSRTLLEIAAELVAPFGIGVVAQADAGEPFKAFALQQGETVWEAIDRLGQFRGLLVVSQPDGSIAFIQPGQDRAGFRLVQGENLMAGSAGHDGRDRFSRYVLKGQSAGDDQVNGLDASGPSAEASDAGVGRYRPLLIMAEDQATLASLGLRAAWEASHRAALGEVAEVTVQGWRDPAGAVWRKNQLVPVVAPWLDIDGERLVSEVTFSLSLEEGSVTRLRLAPPDAFRPEPPSAGAGR